MAKMISAILVLILFAIGVSGQTWKKHESIDGSYSVEFPPGEPTRGARRLEDENRNHIMLRSMALTSGEIRFIASHYDVPSDTKFSFSRTRDGIVTRLKGKLATESSARSAGMQIRSFKVYAKTADGHDIVVSARLMFNGSRVYLMQVIFPRSIENPITEGNARSFFNSFLLKENQ